MTCIPRRAALHAHSMTTTPIRVRFAPSPTGHLHIGGARTALYNWLFARQTGGVFVLRIEDTDRERSTQEFTDSILDGMRWLGLTWDEGPFFQTERSALYKEYADRLLAEGKAYRCTCTPTELDAMRKQAMAEGRKPGYDRRCRDAQRATHDARPACIRLKAPLGGTTVMHDMVRGDIAFENTELDDLILVRSDGTPTYNFVVVVDDVSMKISHVIRGDDHINNTPRQLLIYKALDFARPIFAHLPMILGGDKQRLSKRHGATSVIAYRDAGYLPEALLNYLARLGWSHGDQEIFTLNEMVQAFSFDHVGRAAGIFDADKLNWVSSEHFKKYSDDALFTFVEPFLKELGFTITDRVFATRAIATERERAKTLRDLAVNAAFYFRSEVVFDEKATAKWLNSDGKNILQDIATIVKESAELNESTLKPQIESLMTARNCKMLQIAQPIRVAMTGTTVSPGIYDVLAILGRDRVLQRIERALAV